MTAVSSPRRRYALVALVAVTALAGCGAAPTGAGSGSPPAAVTAVAVTSTASSSGCGRRPTPTSRVTGATGTGDVVQTLRVGALDRSYRLAVPTHYRSSVASPLILLFHGSGSNALQTSVYTQMPKRAARDGYLVATPDARDGQWQLSSPGARTDDLAFVAALVSSLSSRYCVDRFRVSAAGISLGSEFASIVACTPADRIAAIGLVAAEFLLRPCRGPIPVVAFHGTADPIVAYRSGGTGAALPGVPVIGVEDNLAHWARLDGCSSGPHLHQVGTMVMRRTWSGCKGGSGVVLYSVLGGGHTWPGSPIDLSAAGFGATTHQVDATGLMLAFFGRHRLER